jgi:hypothetical protein
VTPMNRTKAGTAATTAAVVAAGGRRAYTSATLTPVSTIVYNPLTRIINELGDYDDGDGSFSSTTVKMSGATTYDEYLRVPLTWRRLEPTKGNYDWDSLDDAFQHAEDTGRRMSFRMRAMISSGNHCPDYALSEGLATSFGGNVEPNWNQASTKERIRLVIAEAAARYADNPLLAAVDVGWLLKFGEWSGSYGNTAPSLTTARWLIDQYALYFPNVPKFINSPSISLDGAIWYAFDTYPGQFHLCSDSLGGLTSSVIDSFEKYRARRSEKVRRHLRQMGTLSVGEHKAPDTITDPETYQINAEEAQYLKISFWRETNMNAYNGASGTAKAAFEAALLLAGYRLAVVSYALPQTATNGTPFTAALAWTNTGNDSIVEPRVVNLHLRSAGGSIVWTGTSSLNPRTIHPTEGSPLTHQDSFTLSGVTAGTYTFCVRIPPLNAADVALTLANSGAVGDRYYPLSSVVVS